MNIAILVHLIPSMTAVLVPVITICGHRGVDIAITLARWVGLDLDGLANILMKLPILYPQAWAQGFV